MRRSLVLLALLVAGCGGGDDGNGASAPPATVALDFTPNAAHAGLYAADPERIVIRPPGGGGADSLKVLESGRADMAVADIHDLGLARERGADLVGVGALVQRPLAAVIARRESGVRQPRDLEGRRVGVAGLPSDDAVLRAVVESDGGDFDRVERVTIGFGAVANLLAGKVDAATAFWNAEGVVLRERGLATREFRLDDYGAPRYPELVLVVTRAALSDRREAVAAALEAIAAGTERALAQQDESVREIASVSEADPALVRAQLEAIAPALSPPVALDRDALEAWADFAADFEILDRRPDVDAAFDLPD
ncbi:MAG TPA: ABC transporter substrate-binding protein [Thermoleophilaceae bacterium]|nr:ABC transporter substrate-binding protein [Thermoleophilaceae bacterium]